MIRIAAIALILASNRAAAAGSAALAVGSVADPWAAWRPLIGEWVAEGGGTPGAGSGTIGFAFDLQGNVMVRRNTVDYPAKADRRAFRHDDLMVLFHENGATRAIYFDSEGHVIRYACAANADGTSWTQVSEGPPPGYRLTYELLPGATLRVSFAISPSGKAQDFKTYVTGLARRVSTASAR